MTLLSPADLAGFRARCSTRMTPGTSISRRTSRPPRARRSPFHVRGAVVRYAELPYDDPRA
ncbi:MAG: hypothetical protein R3F60_33920 [bacterium]